MKKNLILTLLHQYTYPQIEPFVKSLKATGYDGELVMFVSDTVSQQTKKKLVAEGVNLVSYNSEYPFLADYANAFKNITPTVSLNNYRFVFYLQFLNDHAGKYDKVMLTDLRDVIFQQDPFAPADDHSIYFFLEDQVQTFKHQFNFEWLTEATDEQTATSLINNVVSCAGITIGRVDLITNYLNYLVDKLKFRDEARWGLDQGIHNSYVYLIQPPAMRLIANNNSYVYTMGAYQPYQLNTVGEVVNPQGNPYAIIHQYDRHGTLMVKIKTQYVGSRLMQKLKRLYYILMP